jgi:TrpR family trp operon transcriptional repressor
VKSDGERIADLRRLARIFGAARNEAERMDLIEDLFTPAEQKDLLERWELVGLLLGGMTQRQVSERLKISLSKVSRGSRVIQFGRGAFRTLWGRPKR